MERARAARVHAIMMQVVGIKEGEGSKAMVTVTRVVGRQTVTTMTRAM